MFSRWAKSECLRDDDLLSIAAEMESGNTDASLGKKVFKKRIAMGDRGKHGGGRAIIAFKQDSNIFFIYGFSKNEKATVKGKELEALQKLAAIYFGYSDDELTKAVKVGALTEIKVKDNE
jgi:hypothetical protein